jgi:hypothetical protein
VARTGLFAGLVSDEDDRSIQVVMVGGEAFYVVDDDGFMRHIECEHVDRQVLSHFHELIQGHESLISEQTMKMIGQEDIFTKAAIETSLQNLEDQFDTILKQGLPEEVRTYLGMLGFRIIIDVRGDVIRIDQPEVSDDPSDD